VGFAVLSIVGFLPSFVPIPVDPIRMLATAAPETFVAALALAIAATAVAVVARRRHRRERRSTIALRISVPGVIVGALLLALALAVESFFGAFHENVAQTEGHRIVESYTARDANLVCDYGSNGYGMDNSQPWYVAYLDAPESLGTFDAARQALRSAGVDSPTPQTPSTLSGDPAPAGTFDLGTTLNDHSDQVTVSRVGAVPKYCEGTIDYDHGDQVKPGRVLILIMVTFPDRY
jgi:hypothetical protein